MQIPSKETAQNYLRSIIRSIYIFVSIHTRRQVRVEFNAKTRKKKSSQKIAKYEHKQM